ncbi:MAG: hypothetical protein H0T42_24150 [Deltaproteobacteria bacterium]|nr:hypothetical protein [Deltaproteobacteria bacterium]
MRFYLVVLLAACGTSDSTGTDGGTTTDSNGPMSDARGSGSIDAPGPSNRVSSTLTSSCGTLQGRAIVNFNGNFGIAFTEDDSPYTFLGSVQFELPDGYTGTIPNPEAWNGSSARRVVATTSTSYQLHGNHCWFNGAVPSAAGSVVITEFRPNDGVVKATFNALQLRSCTASAVCTVSGSIETTAEGVFD